MKEDTQPDPAAPGRADGDAFAKLAEPHRAGIRLHCYRMLGSVLDAEDAVQETFIRGWRSFAGFRGGSSLRTWLYRIAMNVCLTALSAKAVARRVLPDLYVPPSNAMPSGSPGADTMWLEPFPDAAIEAVADPHPDPAARYEAREAVQLAFIAAIQHLPPRQRAVLLLCDAMGWPAKEVAESMETSVAAVNSALQRARATMASVYPDGRPVERPSFDDAERDLLTRYMTAWEGRDVDGLAHLLSVDAVYSMPPWHQWYRGRESIRTFFAQAWSSYGPADSFRAIETQANGQCAVAMYHGVEDAVTCKPHSLHLLEMQGDRITSVTAFVGSLGRALFPAFGLRPDVPVLLSPQT